MLILARHGRTAANAAGLLQGRLDLPLDDEGQRQAAAVAAAIGPVDRVITSPLLRARQTAAMFGDDVTVDERWIELSYGSFEGVPMADVGAGVWERWKTDNDFAPAGGESLNALGARVRAGCTELLADVGNGARIVVVTHVSPMKAAVAWALDADIAISWRCHLDHAAVCRIAASSSGPSLRTFNERLW